MNLNLNTLKVNDRVGIARHYSWSIHSEGIYVVTKVNKVRIILARESDGYVREFSTKTGIEKGDTRYHSPFIESVADKEQRDKINKFRAELEGAWGLVEQAAHKKNIDSLREAVATLEKYFNKGEKNG